MKIKRIYVENLFGIFSHDIPFNLDEHVTIIHGPNGFGKTVVLTLLSDLFNSDFYDFKKYQFDVFGVEFDTNCKLLLIKAEKKSKIHDKEKQSSLSKENLDSMFPDDGNEIIAELWINNKLEKKETIKSKIDERNDRIYVYIRNRIPELERMARGYWYDRYLEKAISTDDVLQIYSDRFPQGFKSKGVPEWLRELLEKINVHFIETQRLLIFSGYDGFDRSVKEPKPVVQKYSEKLSTIIKEKLAEYGSLSQSKDRNFPIRLVEGHGPVFSIEDLKDNLSSLEEKRTLLEKTGLLDKEKEIDLSSLFEKINESNRHIMATYIEDNKEKLSTFDELYKKINTFLNIINSRFSYKQMYVNKNDGFIFKTKQGEVLLPKMLSSGEQHEVVLFYQLLFEVKSKSVILIDEPELSLHVYWQEQFLNDLKRIAEFRSFDILIATHSPDIINDQWNLTVELKGPEVEG